VKSTFSRIAHVGGVEPNAEAAKSWLSSLDQPWLLLIENANGDASGVNLPDLFPEGRRGTVLVTTRNSSYRTHGTVGSRWLRFEKMDADEADELLLRAASIQNRDVATRNGATSISKTLGFLPLALVHAGKAILDGLCTLTDYVDYFWRFLDRVRQNTFDDDESNMRVYSTYEILFLGLESKRDQCLKGYVAAGDAVELLKVFSFLSCENIQLDILIKAVENFKIEQYAQNLDAKQHLQKQQNAIKLLTWAELIQKIKLIRNFEVLKENPPILPAVLREYDIDRLRKALTLLAQLALITHHDISDHYSVHPLVHIWSRYRPEMKLREQAVWCQAAATTLAHCVLLPPLGTTESDVRLRLQLIPHVTHVLRCQNDINLKFQELRRKRNKLWPLFGKHKFNMTDARMYAKFSMVYAQGGMWTDAEMLQRHVKDFVCSMMGTNHPVAVDIVLALSGSLMNQTRANEAADLQNQALGACINIHGPEHTKTLMVMSMLATSYVYGGRFQAAMDLYEEAIEKLTQTKGIGDEDTLRAIDGLGRLMMRYQRHADAESLHERAAIGLEKALGKTDLDTLTAKASLAMAKLQLKGDKIPAAHKLIEYVYEERKKQLGKEHPLTLLAICDFARIEAALGNTEKVEGMMLGALAIAKRNLGEDHQGVLMGMTHLANLYVQTQRYQEAENILVHVIRPEKYINSVRDDGEHPDRIAALWYLMSCYSAQDKNREALSISYQLYEAIENCGGEGLGKDHIMAKKVLERRRELETSLGPAV
jgi:tetratricopeptide (TPR) repeat protein